MRWKKSWVAHAREHGCALVKVEIDLQHVPDEELGKIQAVGVFSPEVARAIADLALRRAEFSDVPEASYKCELDPDEEV